MPLKLARRVSIKLLLTLLNFTLQLKQRFQRFPAKTIYLGSEYGGWYISPGTYLSNSIIFSAGLGEDASFDVEIIEMYNLCVISLDPTPRAIQHYNRIIQCSGNSKVFEYGVSGLQSVKNYDLTSVSSTNFVLIKKALLDYTGKANFYPPIDQQHVSFRINGGRSGDRTLESIQVDTITVGDLMNELHIEEVPLIKLDIEGSEYRVIDQFLSDNIFPNQLLVEYHFDLEAEGANVRLFYKCHQKLNRNKYKIIKVNGANFTYLRSV